MLHNEFKLYGIQRSLKSIPIQKYKQMSMEQPINQHQLDQELLSSREEEDIETNQPSTFQKFSEFFFKDVQICQRKINLKGKVIPRSNQTNIVRNTKYTIPNFIFIVLLNQFKHFFNLFFLINSLTQLCPYLRVGLFFTCIGPLLLVLTLTMCKQAYDDIKTFKRDKEANSKLYEIVTSKGFMKVKSQELKVGDIVKIIGGDRVPADMIILYSNDPQGCLFLKTDQLDGQTDWKLRKAIKKTQSSIKSQIDILRFPQSDHFCIVKPPNAEIYDFEGFFDDTQKITLENTMWASTVLTNGEVIGLVTYIGRQTRISMGGSKARTKFGILDSEINFLSKILFAIMVSLSILFLVLQHTQAQYIPIQFMRMLILLSSIIPISMRVNLDFAKIYYSVLINKDDSIQGSTVRNTNCPEELGRVKYILSDKTGTLTKNQMLLKQISIDHQIKFTNQSTTQIRQILKQCEGSFNIRATTRKDKLKNVVMALSLCHNVAPAISRIQSEKQFQASSPDEVAFVKLTEQFGIAITERTQSSITLKMPSNILVLYQIKYIFPFRSEAKRMSIILKNTRTNEYLYLLKGADIIMKEFIQNRQKKHFIDEECKELSIIGLRTLVLAYKVLNEQFYQEWSKNYEQACNKFQNNQKRIEELMEKLQNGVEFLGITGIEDTLQNKLTSTIECLRGAGIKIWMITGDKMETAECIGRSCGLQKFNEPNYKIQDVASLDELQEHFSEIRRNFDRLLVIDGKTLNFILNSQTLSTEFFQTALKLQGIICCRCSPEQKKKIADGVKKHKNKKQALLTIGDGGNDVGMIQTADAGVGIVGKQGMQAALAADFSIKEFSDLRALLLYHGRLAYVRSSLLACFIIHRGFIIAAIQIIFSCIFYYVSIPVFNSYLELGYATVFTFWPVFALILSQDVNMKVALQHPELYQLLQRQDYLSLFNFLFWIWKAIFQAAIIIILTLVFFQENSYLQFETISFTVLIITEYSMTATYIKRIHAYLFYCIAGSLICYIICLIFLKSYLHIFSLDFQDVCYILLIFGMSWGPFLIWKIIKRQKWPTSVEKIMKNEPDQNPKAPFRDPFDYMA